MAMPFAGRYALEAAMTISVRRTVDGGPLQLRALGRGPAPLGSLNRPARMFDALRTSASQVFHSDALEAARRPRAGHRWPASSRRHADVERLAIGDGQVRPDQSDVARASAWWLPPRSLLHGNLCICFSLAQWRTLSDLVGSGDFAEAVQGYSSKAPIVDQGPRLQLLEITSIRSLCPADLSFLPVDSSPWCIQGPVDAVSVLPVRGSSGSGAVLVGLTYGLGWGLQGAIGAGSQVCVAVRCWASQALLSSSSGGLPAWRGWHRSSLVKGGPGADCLRHGELLARSVGG